MALGKGKPGLLIALGGAPKKHPEPDDDQMGGPSDMDADNEDEPGMGSVKQMAADDAFDAVKSDDRALFADALDRYVKACMGE